MEERKSYHENGQLAAREFYEKYFKFLFSNNFPRGN